MPPCFVHSTSQGFTDEVGVADQGGIVQLVGDSRMADSTGRKYVKGFRLKEDQITHWDNPEDFVTKSNVFVEYSQGRISQDAFSLAREIVHQGKVGEWLAFDSEVVRVAGRDNFFCVAELAGQGFAELAPPE